MDTPAGLYRLITRSDFDGLVCAVLLRELGLVGDIKFVHPKDMQDGLIEVTPNDITTNLPYVEGVHLAFDHHISEVLRVGKHDNHIIEPDAPSAARVVYNYYGGKDRFPTVPEDLLAAVDKGDSANFTLEEVLQPRDWVLLNFITDARTGLGRFKSFRISNYQLMMDLIDYCRDHTIKQILALDDVRERVELYESHKQLFVSQIRKRAVLEKSILVLDLTSEETVYAGNRFVKYALYPEINVSIQMMWGFKNSNTVFSVGKSIFNRSCEVNIGELLLPYGGGGHVAAGTCQVDTSIAPQVLAELIEALRD